jgi:hypothetical protein
LPHSGTYAAYLGTVNSVKTWGTVQTLGSVRFAPLGASRNDALGLTKNDKATMTYDCFNSTPLALTFKVNDKISDGTNTYYVREAKPCYATASSVHHWRLILSGVYNA